MRWLVLLPLLAGCAPSLGTASASGGIISHYSTSPNKALAKAQAHCEQFGKDAVVTGQHFWDDNMTFQCVSR